MKGFRHNITNALLVLGGAIAAYGLVELTAISTGFLVPQDFRDRQRWFYGFLEPNDTLGFKPRANLKNFKLSWLEESVSEVVNTDEYGFRNVQRDYTEANIFFIGDSFTWGAWVERDKTFYGLIEKQIDQPVITLGVGGYGIQQYETLFKEFAVKYKPELVVLGIFANDLIPLTPTFENYYENIGWDEYAFLAWHKKTLAHRIYSEVKVNMKEGTENLNQEDRKRAANGLTLFRHRGASSTYLENDENEQVEDVFHEIINSAKAENIEVVIFLFPSKESAYLSHYEHLFPDGIDYLGNEEEGYRRLCRIAFEQGVKCIDLTESFRKQARERILYFQSDPHWNEAGHQLAATEILSELTIQLR